MKLQNQQCEEEEWLKAALFDDEKKKKEEDYYRIDSISLLGTLRYLPRDELLSLMESPLNTQNRVFKLLALVRTNNHPKLPVIELNSIWINQHFIENKCFETPCCLVDCFWPQEIKIESRCDIILLETGQQRKEEEKKRKYSIPNTPHLWSIIFGPLDDGLALSRTRVGGTQIHTRLQLFDPFSEWMESSFIGKDVTYITKSPIVFILKNSEVLPPLTFAYKDKTRPLLTKYLNCNGFWTFPMVVYDQSSIVGVQPEDILVYKLLLWEQKFLPLMK